MKNKIYTYKNVNEFSKKVLKLNDYDSWVITFKNKLAWQIIEKRKEAGLSQADLAKILGTTQSVVSRIESGLKRNITIDYLLKVLSALGVSPKDIIKKAA